MKTNEEIAQDILDNLHDIRRRNNNRQIGSYIAPESELRAVEQWVKAVVYEGICAAISLIRTKEEIAIKQFDESYDVTRSFYSGKLEGIKECLHILKKEIEK